MNYSSFCEYLLADLMNNLEPDTKITKESVRKNNNVFWDALIIRIPGTNSAPVIYLEPLYNNYKNGSSIDKIAHMVLARLAAELPLSQELIQSTGSLDAVREKIAFRLISKKDNEPLLTDVPWVPFLDLAVIFILHLGIRDDKQITSVIHNHQAKSWNLSPEDLYELAKENTPHIYPSCIGRLEHLLLGWDEEEERLKPCESILPTLFVLSNQTGVNGATCILYEGIIKDFAEKIGSDLIILPSSIHEVLLLPDSHTHEYEMFHDMIQHVNAEEVPKEDILSDELYLYRREGNAGIIRWMPSDSDSAGACGTESL